MSTALRIIPVTNIGEIPPGSDLGFIIYEALQNQRMPLERGDILVSYFAEGLRWHPEFPSDLRRFPQHSERFEPLARAPRKAYGTTLSQQRGHTTLSTVKLRLARLPQLAAEDQRCDGGIGIFLACYLQCIGKSAC